MIFISSNLTERKLTIIQTQVSFFALVNFVEITTKHLNSTIGTGVLFAAQLLPRRDVSPSFSTDPSRIDRVVSSS